MSGLVDTLGESQPSMGTLPRLNTLQVALTELLDLSLFPQLRVLKLEACWDLERLVSTMLMTALQRLEIRACKRLKVLPDLTQSKLLQQLDLSGSGITLNAREIAQLEAQCPGIQILGIQIFNWKSLLWDSDSDEEGWNISHVTNLSNPPLSIHSPYEFLTCDAYGVWGKACKP